MSSVRNHTPPDKQCQCDKCGAVSSAPPGSTHRKCGGGPSAKPPAERGKWQAK